MISTAIPTIPIRASTPANPAVGMPRARPILPGLSPGNETPAATTPIARTVTMAVAFQNALESGAPQRAQHHQQQRDARQRHCCGAKPLARSGPGYGRGCQQGHEVAGDQQGRQEQLSPGLGILQRANRESQHGQQGHQRQQATGRVDLGTPDPARQAHSEIPPPCNDRMMFIPAIIVTAPTRRSRARQR